MTVWHVAGNSGLGKTLLLEALIPQLSGTVRVLKHSHHALERDAVGTDTARLSQATSTVRIHEDGLVLRGKRPDFVDFVTWYASQCDHLLIEGLKFLNTPKIYLSRDPNQPHITVGTLVGPKRPTSLNVFWIAADLPLTRSSATDIACELVKEATGATFTWDALIQALKTFTGDS